MASLIWVLEVMLLLSWRVSLTLCGEFDQSTLVYCDGDIFPDSGYRLCYRRSVSPDECNIAECSVSVINKTRGQIKFIGGQTKIASPQFFKQDGTYQNKRLCQYHVPACPAGTIAHIEWNKQTFILEETVSPSINLCTDHVNIFSLDLQNLGIVLDDRNVLCGNPDSISERFSGLPLKVEFKSGVSGRFKGFRIDILCAPVSSENVDGGQMKKRDVISFYENNNKTSRGERKMDMNCTKVPVSSPPPTPPHKQPVRVPQVGNRLRVPRRVNIVYKRKCVLLVKDKKVLRTFTGIRRLFFYTGFNGTRTFRSNAFVPEDEIFGGGDLRIINDCAYYVTFSSPPRLEPNSEELKLISFLINATSPFFEDQDIDDEEDPPEITTSPPTKPTTPTTPPPTKPKPTTDTPTTDMPTRPDSKPTTDMPTRPDSKPTTDMPTRPDSKPTTDMPTRPDSKPTTDMPTRPDSKPTTDMPTRPDSKPTTDMPTRPDSITDTPTRPHSKPTPTPNMTQTTEGPRNTTHPLRRGKRDAAQDLESRKDRVKRQQSRITHKPATRKPPVLDPRVDPKALKLAFKFENACNIFLRKAARSFLTILREEGII